MVLGIEKGSVLHYMMLPPMLQCMEPYLQVGILVSQVTKSNLKLSSALSLPIFHPKKICAVAVLAPSQGLSCQGSGNPTHDKNWLAPC